MRGTKEAVYQGMPYFGRRDRNSCLGCPNLAKIKVKKCRGVSGGIAEWLRERRESLIVNWDDGAVGPLDASVSHTGAQEMGMEFHQTIRQGTDAAAGSSSNGPLTLFRTKFGFLAYRNLVQCAFRRCPNDDDNSSTRNE